MTETGVVVDNLKKWYNDPTMIGRHFLVYSAKAPRIKRQYTICSSINPEVSVELLELAKSKQEGRQTTFDDMFLKAQDTNLINLTLKTYNTKKGLATRIHGT